MSQISVVHYNPLNKINVLQQNNVNKQNDRQIIVLRKPPQILPQPATLDKEDILITNTKKKQHTDKDTKSNVQPVAVARRNARERNRVKQVNNGFANLRSHIPNFIAAAYEGSGARGGNKKLSKVETLRMAVEYIRSLEDLLAVGNDNAEITDQVSEMSYPSPSSSVSPTHQYPNSASYNYQVLSPPADDDDEESSNIPQQFIKINTSNGTYQIISSTLYENSENLDPLTAGEELLTDPSLLDPSLEFSQDLSYLSSFHTTSSLSPSMYSDSSFSPRSEQGNFMPILNTPPQEPFSPNVVGNITIKTEVQDLPVISLKTENELPEDQKENIAGVLQWWEQQPQNTGS